MHRRAAHRLATVVAAHLQRVGAVDDAIIRPEELGLFGFVGSKILQRTEVRPGIERDDRKAVFGQFAGQRASACSRPDDGEIDRLIFPVFAHGYPSPRTENVGCASLPRARSVQGVTEHGG